MPKPDRLESRILGSSLLLERFEKKSLQMHDSLPNRRQYRDAAAGHCLRGSVVGSSPRESTSNPSSLRGSPGAVWPGPASDRLARLCGSPCRLACSGTTCGEKITQTLFLGNHWVLPREVSPVTTAAKSSLSSYFFLIRLDAFPLTVSGI